MKFLSFDPKSTGCNRLQQLNELDDLCFEAYENAKLYKEKTKMGHDKCIKHMKFYVGEKVLINR